MSLSNHSLVLILLSSLIRPASSLVHPREGAREGDDMNPGFNEALPGFFQTTGARVVLGRDFTERDTVGAPKVVIVNETFVKRFYPRESPLGHRIGWGESGPLDMEIVGLARDMKGGDLRKRPSPGHSGRLCRTRRRRR